VELLVPCEREAAERIQVLWRILDTDLAPEVRESVGFAFRELLLNAIEWGGQLDPNRKVRIAYLRARRMLLYRIADPGLDSASRPEAVPGVSIPEGSPLDHMSPVGEDKGLRPRRVRIMIRSQGRRTDLPTNESSERSGGL
jgi:hypothetical protein